MSLNEAVEKAAVLTINEFSFLSLTYILKHTRTPRVGNKDTFARYLNAYVIPLVADISEEESSFSYLEAQGCANRGVAKTDLMTIFRTSYGGAISNGFTRDQLESHLPDGKKTSLNHRIIPCMNDREKLQIGAITKGDLAQAEAKNDLTTSELDNVWAMFESTMWSEAEFLKQMDSSVPGIESLFRVWSATMLAITTLTSVGLVIGHANLSGKLGFEADLSIWIK